jgi:anti-anti-sigma factor
VQRPTSRRLTAAAIPLAATGITRQAPGVAVDQPVFALRGTITVQTEPGGPVLCLAGEVDGGVVAAFERDTGAPSPVTAIDAGAVTFIGSAGIALLVRWAQATAADSGGRVLLRRSARSVDRVLAVMGLEGRFARPTVV